MGGFWFAASLVLYVLTGARGLIWADPSKLTLYALEGYFPSLNPGDHAGWTVLAWAWLRLVGGDPVVAAHRLSALCGALVVVLAALLVLARSGDRARAHTAAALLMVLLPLWWVATVAETYAPALAATLAGALALSASPRGWRWWVAGGFWGLALAMHVMSVFLIAPLAWEADRKKTWRVLPGLLVGSAPVWWAVFGGPRDPLTGFAASDASTWRWHWEAFLALARAPRSAVVLGVLMLYALGLVGVVALWRGRRGPRGSPAWAWSLGALFLLLLTYAPYRLHLMVAFLLVGLLLALPVRVPAWARVAHVVMQALVYLAIPAVLTAAGRQSLGVRVLPHRNNALYFLCPVKSIRFRPLPSVSSGRLPPSPPRTAPLRWREALDPGVDLYLAGFAPCTPTGAAVVADFNPGAVLRLAQVVRGWRTDLEIRPVAVDVALGAPDPAAALVATVQREIGARPVVLADSYAPYYHPRQLSTHFALRPCGPCVQVEPLGPGSIR
ncbi:MAG: hypothetical protein A2Y78_01130 [Acidobacteria bacterium RBG_13_68_16]|nr:MAG: hypothetical protein A2Y78_01130 [Acidobacteria bacterium RBG_13_68_16]